VLRTLFDDSLFKFWQILTHPPSYKVGGDIKVSKVHSYLEMSPPAISAGATEIAVGTNYKSDPSFYAPLDWKEQGVDLKSVHNGIKRPATFLG